MKMSNGILEQVGALAKQQQAGFADEKREATEKYITLLLMSAGLKPGKPNAAELRGLCFILEISPRQLESDLELVISAGRLQALLDKLPEREKIKEKIILECEQEYTKLTLAIEAVKQKRGAAIQSARECDNARLSIE